MSMYEIEDLMEATVRFIEKLDCSPSGKRNLIWNVFHLQNQFDCKFTHFRMMDILTKNEYVQEYDIQAFPLAALYPDFFNNLPDEEFAWIRQVPTEAWSETNQEVAYWDGKRQKILVDFGSEYYALHADEAPQVYEPMQLGYDIIQKGSKQGNKDIVCHWTAFMLLYLLAWFPPGQAADGLKEQFFADIKDIFYHFGGDNHTTSYPQFDIYHLDETWIEGMPATQRTLVEYFFER